MDWPEVKAWRRVAREKILAARAAIALPVRQAMARRLIEHLRTALKDRPAPISFYWPIKAEPDLRPLMQELDAAGIALCLPVATRLGEPLTFRPWHKDAAMTRGFWNIPVPATDAEVTPRTLIAPFLGYDGLSYRLGYGGGFFDRTLAKLGAEARAIGIGWSMFRLKTIQPQPHDIRMSAIVTQTGTVLQDEVPAVSEVCYLSEADAVYAGYDTPAETAAALESLRGTLPPERAGLLDYALWRLDASPEAPPSAATRAPTDVLAGMLPRIRDDALHAAVAALHGSLLV
ncbi:MAG TPA: 5-formyltetrahydrofolate cyclo-ligase [Dongiaceae bacterium]|nr:5-formyltetrahydrofolate cyclo-ligase [Dongiaceae bacterium]